CLAQRRTQPEHAVERKPPAVCKSPPPGRSEPPDIALSSSRPGQNVATDKRPSLADCRQTSTPAPPKLDGELASTATDLAQRGRIATWRHTEHPTLLATELRRAAVAYRETSTGDVRTRRRSCWP